MLLTRTRPGLERSRSRAIEEEDERYNPIRPSNGNMVIRGGSDIARSSRTPRLSMADSRAREIQTRRLTPGTGATPTMGLSEVRGGSSRIQDMMKSLQQTREFDEGQIMDLNPMGMLNQLMPRYLSPAQQGLKRPMSAGEEVQLKQAPPLKRTKGVPKGRGYCGGAAVPSMGLSQFRGGANIDDLLDRTNVARSGAYEGQGYMREKSMPPVAMRGGKYHRDGNALSEHLLATLGNASHQKLLEGIMRHAMGIHGSGFFDRLKRGFESFGRKVKNEFVNPESVLRGKVLPVASKVGKILSPVLNLASPGAGTAVSTGLDTAQNINQEAKNLGFGRSRGCGKKRRAPAGASDGRRARAEIVRRVMAERGVKMIEASKIVKAEGLY